MIHVFAHDRELRAWLVDELALISPVGSIEVVVIDSLDQVDACSVLIAGIDRLSANDVDRLRELIAMHVIVIGVGSPQSIELEFRCVLDTKLTSRQLKRAMRDVSQLRAVS